jgi:hypothetical protein
MSARQTREQGGRLFAYVSGAIVIGGQSGADGRPSAGRTHHGAHTAGWPSDPQNAGSG